MGGQQRESPVRGAGYEPAGASMREHSAESNDSQKHSSSRSIRRHANEALLQLTRHRTETRQNFFNSRALLQIL